MSSNADLELRLLASTIVRGSTVRAECVQCGETTMTVTHKDDGRIAYHCKRATCGVAGYVGASMFREQREAPPPPRDWHYTRSLYALDDVDYDYFAERFGLLSQMVAEYVRLTESGEYAFIVKAPERSLRGHVIRQPTWKSVRHLGRVAPRRGRRGEPKTREFLEPNKPCTAWFPPAGPGLTNRRAIVVVEDCVSAMCAAQQGYTAVALLGTFATWKEADEIRKIASTRNVLVAFDNDATSVAYDFSQKWGLSFHNCRVVRLERDLKDEESNRITSVLGD